MSFCRHGENLLLSGRSSILWRPDGFHFPWGEQSRPFRRPLAGTFGLRYKPRFGRKQSIFPRGFFMSNSSLAQANPAPLGLFGFAMTTILLNIHNAGLYPLNGMIMGMGVFYGGIAQIIAGILEWKKGNTFGGLAFTSYGSFWLTLVFLWCAPALGIGAASDPTAMGCYLALWGVFTFVLFLCTLKGAMTGRLVFGSLVILFGLLALANFTGSHEIHTIAGLEGILCGGFAFYEASALIINEKMGRKVLPL